SQRSGPHPHPHSFPTRRSSDLVLGLTTLPVTQYPDIAPPTVQVIANYPGANAQTVLESVIIPIEEQINGVEDMTYITSTASNNGDRKSTRLNSSHVKISYAVFC